MINWDNELGQRTLQRIQAEDVIWLTTVSPRGAPQPRPVWFVWDGKTFLVYSTPQAKKINHLARNPNVALHFNTDAGGEDIQVILGTARIDINAPPSNLNTAYSEKYRAGILAVRPDAKLLVKYAGTTGAAFKDPTKGKELALAEYHDGADIIFHASGSTGLGVFEAARDLHRLAIGVDSDQYDEAPGVVLTSMVKRVDTAVFETIKQTQAGQWTGGVREFGLKENGVTWVCDGRNRNLIPNAAKAKVDSLQNAIIAGAIVVPTQ